MDSDAALRLDALLSAAEAAASDPARLDPLMDELSAEGVEHVRFVHEATAESVSVRAEVGLDPAPAALPVPASREPRP